MTATVKSKPIRWNYMVNTSLAPSVLLAKSQTTSVVEGFHASLARREEIARTLLSQGYVSIMSANEHSNRVLNLADLDSRIVTGVANSLINMRQVIRSTGPVGFIDDIDVSMFERPERSTFIKL